MAKLLVVLCVLCGCGSRSDDKPAPASEPPGSGSVVAKARAAADASRWLWIEAAGGTYLAFYYVDRSAGPSAKGAAVGEPPTAEQLKKAIEMPSNTFREPRDASFVTA